jgi:hypothetical protein
MSDGNSLLQELRAAVKSGKGNYGHRLLCGQAADEIERLQRMLDFPEKLPVVVKVHASSFGVGVPTRMVLDCIRRFAEYAKNHRNHPKIDTANPR